VSKYTHKTLFLMLFFFLGAIGPQNEKPLSSSIMVGYLQIMAGYHPIMLGYCPVKDKMVLILIDMKGQTCKKQEGHRQEAGRLPSRSRSSYHL
jgi:hypothetical protein